MKNHENYCELQRYEATGKPRKICQGCDETKFYRWVLVFEGAIDSINGKKQDQDEYFHEVCIFFQTVCCSCDATKKCHQVKQLKK